jgi:hypothetical protein
MLQAYPECRATVGQLWTELLRQIKNWSTNDSNKFPADIQKFSSTACAKRPRAPA